MYTISTDYLLYNLKFYKSSNINSSLYKNLTSEHKMNLGVLAMVVHGKENQTTKNIFFVASQRLFLSSFFQFSLYFISLLSQLFVKTQASLHFFSSTQFIQQIPDGAIFFSNGQFKFLFIVNLNAKLFVRFINKYYSGDKGLQETNILRKINWD